MNEKTITLLMQVDDEANLGAVFARLEVDIYLAEILLDRIDDFRKRKEEDGELCHMAFLDSQVDYFNGRAVDALPDGLASQIEEDTLVIVDGRVDLSQDEDFMNMASERMSLSELVVRENGIVFQGTYRHSDSPVIAETAIIPVETLEEIQVRLSS